MAGTRSKTKASITSKPAGGKDKKARGTGNKRNIDSHAATKTKRTKKQATAEDAARDEDLEDAVEVSHEWGEKKGRNQRQETTTKPTNETRETKSEGYEAKGSNGSRKEVAKDSSAREVKAQDLIILEKGLG